MLEDFKPQYDMEDTVAIKRFSKEDMAKILSEKLGEGSDRIVYAINDKLAIKIVISPSGIAKNDLEGDGYAPVPQVYETGKDYVIVQRLYRDDKKANEILKPLKKFSVFDFEKKISELQEAFYNVEEKAGIDITSAMSYDLLWNDFIAGRNWGFDEEGKLYHLDAVTFNKDILNILNEHKQEWEEIKRLRRASA